MGLAPSTVSRAFTDPDRGNFQTVEKIMQVAQEMGYRRHPPRLTPERTLSRTINLIVQDSSNPFYVDFLGGVLEQTRNAGYLTMVADTGEALNMERAYIRRFTHAVDGMIAAAPTTPDSELRELGKITPLVLFNREVTSVSSVLAGSSDDAFQLVQHLYGLNHRRVVFCSGPKFAWTNKMRIERLTQYTQEFGIDLEIIGPFIPTLEQGRVAAALALKQHPTAIMGFNDQLATGIIQYLLSEGYEVPGDISVTGFDNTQAAHIIHTGLTCLNAPLKQAGKTAVDLLFHHLAGQQAPQSVQLSSKLVVRGSTGSASKRR